MRQWDSSRRAGFTALEFEATSVAVVVVKIVVPMSSCYDPQAAKEYIVDDDGESSSHHRIETVDSALGRGQLERSRMASQTT